MDENKLYIDELTGVFNRRYLNDQALNQIRSLIIKNSVFALVIVDIDHFKEINDSHGHLVGDKIIKEFADFIKKSLRASDSVIRYGGDEFVCIMPGVTKLDTENIYRRMIKNCRERQFEGLKITLSAGLASFPDDGSSFEELLNNADQALYEAKRSGRDRLGLVGEKKAQIPIRTFINRLNERELINKTLRSESNAAQIIVIEGIVGAGKTRLSREVLTNIKGHEIIWSDCIFFTNIIPYFAIREMIKYRLRRMGRGMLNEMPESLKIEIGKLIPELAGQTADSTKNFNQVLDRYRLYESIRWLIEIDDRKKVIVIDNLQWIEHDSIEVIKYLLRALRFKSIIFILIHRTEEKTVLVENFLSYISRENDMTTIKVDPFSQPDIRAAIKAIIGDEAEDSLVEYITRESGGIPFYIEEIMRNLVDYRFLKIENNRWFFTKPTREILPRNLADIAINKYKNLSNEAKNVLEIASVIGKFDVDIIRQITAYNEGHVIGLINDIDRLGFVRFTKNQFEFNEAISRAAIYNTYIKGIKARELHQLAGEMIEKKKEVHPDEMIEELAFHYYQAADKEKGVKYAIRAGEIAKNKYANQAALKYYSWAIELLEKNPDDVETGQIVDYIHKKVEILHHIGEYKKAISEVEKGLKISRDRNDRFREGDMNLLLAEVYLKISRFKEAHNAAEQAISIFTELNNQKLLALSYRTKGVIFYDQGACDEALEFYTKSLNIMNEIGDSELASKTMHNLGNYYFHIGDFNRALEMYGEALRTHRKIGDKAGASKALGNIGNIYMELNDYDNALKTYLESTEIFHSIGSKVDIAIGLTNLGSLWAKLGDYASAFKCYEECLQIEREIGDKGGEVLTLACLGIVYFDCGYYEKAKAYAEQALKIEETVNSNKLKFYNYSTLTIIYIELEQYDQAYQFLTKAKQSGGSAVENAKIMLPYEFAYMLNQKNYDACEKIINEYKGLYKDIAPRLTEGSIKQMQARLYIAQGKYDPAKEMIEAAIKIYSELKENSGLGDLYKYSAELEVDRGDKEKARKLYETAREYYQKMSALPRAKKIEAILSNL